MKENSEHCLLSVLCWLNLLLLTWTGTFGMIYLSYKPGTIGMELFLWKIPGLRRSVIRRLGLRAGLSRTNLYTASDYDIGSDKFTVDDIWKALIFIWEWLDAPKHSEKSWNNLESISMPAVTAEVVYIVAYWLFQIKLYNCYKHNHYTTL